MTFALASERECDVMTIVIVVLVARYSRTLHITLMSHFIFTIWSFGIGGERGIEWFHIKLHGSAKEEPNVQKLENIQPVPIMTNINVRND